MCSLLGLEEELWPHVQSTEKAIFYKLLLSLILISLLLIGASIGNVYLIFSNWTLAISGGLLITFVFWNIIRFTMLTIRISPVEINLEELDSQFQPQQSNTIVSETASASPSGSRNFLNRIGQIFGQPLVRMRRNFGDWFGFGRWLLYGIFLLIIAIQAFPITFLLMKTKAIAFNDRYRSNFLEQWKRDHVAHFESSLKDNRKEIASLETDLLAMQAKGFTSDDPYYQQKLEECNIQKNKLQDLQLRFQSEMEIKYANLCAKNKDKFFLVSLIRYVSGSSLYKGIYLIFGLLYAFPLVLLFRLKGDPQYSYFRDSAMLFKEAIYQDYLAYQNSIQSLHRNPRYLAAGIKVRNPEDSSVWLDPPFRTRYSMQYEPKPEVSLQSNTLA
jgi:hypothetical protein